MKFVHDIADYSFEWRPAKALPEINIWLAFESAWDAHIKWVICIRNYLVKYFTFIYFKLTYLFALRGTHVSIKILKN